LSLQIKGYFLRELWISQGIPPEEDGVFVLVLPSSAIGAVIGTKGAKIKEIMEASGTTVDVGKEPIIGMPDIPVVISGLQDQVLTATSMTNSVMQELADRDRLHADAFVYKPGRGVTATPRTPRSAGGMLVARFVVPRGAAGFLLGCFNRCCCSAKQSGRPQLGQRSRPLAGPLLR